MKMKFRHHAYYLYLIKVKILDDRAATSYSCQKIIDSHIRLLSLICIVGYFYQFVQI